MFPLILTVLHRDCIRGWYKSLQRTVSIRDIPTPNLTPETSAPDVGSECNIRTGMFGGPSHKYSTRNSSVVLL